jgi:uncharacterized pyridoxal phosphate-containing UPF0001 family protein
MAAPKGHPKYPGAGRKKGTPNKATQNLHEICAKHNINVFEAMVIDAVNHQPEDKKSYFDKLSEIAKYLYAKRKEVELHADIEPIEIILRDYTSKK